MRLRGDRADPVIAIDGPGGAGKSTTAHAVAEIIDCRHLDSGALYRAVAFQVLRNGAADPARTDLALAAEAAARQVAIEPLGDEPCFRVLAAGEALGSELRAPEVTSFASKIAVFRGVRDELLGLQRKAIDLGAIVCDGRDMGTVVFPDAALKVFLVAEVEERARRRYLARTDGGPMPATMVADLRIRDERDATRKHAPLAEADEARVIDTTLLTLEEQTEIVAELAVEAGFRRR